MNSHYEFLPCIDCTMFKLNQVCNLYFSCVDHTNSTLSHVCNLYNKNYILFETVLLSLRCIRNGRFWPALSPIIKQSKNIGNKPGTMVHAQYPKYLGSRGRGIKCCRPVWDICRELIQSKTSTTKGKKKHIIDSDRRKLDRWWYMLSEEVIINCANMIVW